MAEQPSGHSAEAISTKVRSGMRAVTVAQVSSQILTICALAILLRYISKEAFGVFGMALPLLTLPRMFATLGISVATVQKDSLNQAQLSALFWLTNVFSVIAAGVTILLGWALTGVYGASQLLDVCVAMAGTTVLAGMSFTHQSVLERKLLLGRLAAIRIAGQLIGLVAAIITAVFLDWGIWALVIQQYVEWAIVVLGCWCTAGWKPNRPERAKIGSLVKFGGYYSTSSIVFYAGQNADKVVLSVLLGATQQGRELIGMYSKLYEVMMKPVQLVTNPTTQVMLPGLSRLKATKDIKTLQELARSFYRFVGVLLIPAAVGLYVVAPDFVEVLGGEEWTEGTSILLALAPVIAVHGLININGSLLAAIGRADQLMKAAIVIALLQVQGAVAGFYLGRQFLDPTTGTVEGVAVGYSMVLIMVVFAPYMIFSLSMCGMRLKPLLVDLMHPLAAAMLMGLSVLFLRGFLLSRDWSTPAVLLVSVLLGVVCYAALAWPKVKRDVIGLLKGNAAS
ncbi:MAG: oligosaccharide flippase family protein [Pirellulaceae bacterium]